MTSVRIFTEYTLDSLEETVNTFLKSFDSIKVVAVDMTETEHDYRMVVIYESQEE